MLWEENSTKGLKNMSNKKLKMKSIKIGKFTISQNSPLFIIAELSANHNGSITTAIETIRAAKRAGADAIKLQTYTADTITIDVKTEEFKIKHGTIWDGKYLYELYQEAYTPWEWHKQLFEIAHEEGLLCFSSPFDKTAVDFLEQFDPPAYKIASLEIQDIPLIEYTASKGRTMIMSTGIADKADIELAIKTCRSVGNNDIVLLKCTSTYPSPMKEVNLATITDFRKRFNVEVGLSDHTMGIVAPITAVALGAKVIEKHFILDKSIGGPDASFSLDEKEFTEMVTAVRQSEEAIGKITYELTEKINNNRKFGRSLFVVEDIKIGEHFTEQNLRSIRPGDGLHPQYYKEIIGKKASKRLPKGTPLQFDHIS
jgi:pseudaminic acid synthase